MEAGNCSHNRNRNPHSNLSPDLISPHASPRLASPPPHLLQGYQISQYDEPICSGGRLEVEVDGVMKRCEGGRWWAARGSWTAS